MVNKRILISGASGLIGGALAPALREKGFDVVHLTRSKKPAASVSVILWDIDQQQIPATSLEGFDVVIHLAGANIADKRWTPAYKEEILASRTRSTELLISALVNCKALPKVFISASAIGYYGNHPPLKIIDETHPAGTDFLADVCRQWEEKTQKLAQKGVRVVNLRFGVVLSAKGGALAKMLPIFRLGLGGVLGSGEQVMSWIALKEIPRIIFFILENENIFGAVNCVAPQPISNKGFTKVLGDVLRRPVALPVPGVGIRFLFGEMGQTLLLGGACVIPKKLLDAGYQFMYPDLRSALKSSLL